MSRLSPRSMKRKKDQHGYAIPITVNRRSRQRTPSEDKPRAKAGKAVPHPLAERSERTRR